MLNLSVLYCINSTPGPVREKFVTVRMPAMVSGGVLAFLLIVCLCGTEACKTVNTLYIRDPKDPINSGT